MGKSAREYANEVLFGPAEMALTGSHLLTASGMNFDTLFGRGLKGWANGPPGDQHGRLVLAIASSFEPDPKERCVLISRHILPYF